MASPLLPALSDLPLLGGFALSYAALAVTPGANFLVVSQISLQASRRHALMSALGVAVGAAITASVALSGAELITPWVRLLSVMQLVFAALLARIGLSVLVKAWAAYRHAPARAVPSPLMCFCLGLSTALMNPLTLMFFLGLALAPNGAGRGFAPVQGAAVVLCVALAWFSFVAVSFSRETVHRAYLRARPLVDGFAGLAILLIAAHLAGKALQS
ncbi:MAG: LysE family transporter [Methylobacterium mesophilicum]|nr:LysE family transporter [Methylobacterium mesophilicum]